MSLRPRRCLILGGLVAVFVLGPITGASANPTDTDTPYSWPGAAIVTVQTTPDGGGFVQSTPYLIDCPLACVRPVDPGTKLVLTATPSRGFEFAGWAGACVGKDNPCTATIAQSANVTAFFTYVGIPEENFGGDGLTVTIVTAPPESAPGGVVFDELGKIDCPQVMCSARLKPGSDDVLVAIPDSGFLVSGFTGCDEQFVDPLGQFALCLVHMGSAREVSALFSRVD